MPTTVVLTTDGSSVVIPAGVTSIAVDLRGGKGSDHTSDANPANRALGGLGARLVATVPVSAGQTYYLDVIEALTGQPNSAETPGGDGGAAAQFRRGASQVLAIAAGGGGAGAPYIFGSGTRGGHGGDGGVPGGNGEDGGNAPGATNKGTGGVEADSDLDGTYQINGEININTTSYGAAGAPGAGWGGGVSGTSGTVLGTGGGGGGGGASHTGTSDFAVTTATPGYNATTPSATVTYNRAPTQPGAFTSPAAAQVFDGVSLITCGASTDPDGDAVVYDTDLSTDSGATWTPIRVAGAGPSFSYDFSAVPESTGAVLRTTPVDSAGLAGTPRLSPTFTVRHNVAPSAPTLVYPANASHVDLAAGFTLDYIANDDDGDTQASSAIRRKLAGAGAYEYWNAGTGAWQSTEVYNPGVTTDVTFPAGKWVNGAVYNYSVRTRDSLGETGPYATDFTVTGGEAPTVIVTAPSGTVTTTQSPLVTWSYADAENHAQQSYRVRLFTAAQVAAGGFDPGVSAAVADSGERTSAAARSWATDVLLDNGESYRAYVRATQQGQQSSAWAWSAFTVDLTPPPAPLLLAVDEPAAGRVRLTVLGTDNLLSAASAGGSTTTGQAAYNGTLSVVAGPDDPDDDGAALLRWTGTADVSSGGGVRCSRVAYTVPPGTAVSGRASVKGTVGVDVRASLLFYDESNTLMSTVDGGDVTLTGSLQPVTVTTTVPVGATQVSLTVRASSPTSIGDTIDIDARAIRTGTDVAFSAGGFAGSALATVERSDDGGETWAPVRGAVGLASDSADQRVVTYDYEAPPGAERLYRATSTRNV